MVVLKLGSVSSSGDIFDIEFMIFEKHVRDTQFVLAKGRIIRLKRADRCDRSDEFKSIDPLEIVSLVEAILPLFSYISSDSLDSSILHILNKCFTFNY